MSKAEQELLNFGLDAVPRQHRPKVWKDALNAFFYDYDFYLPPDFALGEFKGCQAGDLSIASIRSDAMTVYRTDSHVSRNALDAYFVLLTTESPISLSQRGKEAVLQPGTFSLVSTSDAYTYIQNDTTTFNNLILPGKMVRQLAPRVNDIVATASDGRVLNRMLYGLATALCSDVDLVDAHAREIVGNQIVEMLGLIADGADDGSSATSIRLAHYGRIQKLIDREFRDHGLTIATISTRLKLSTRYLQEIAAANATTISRMIRARRIAEAKRLLTYRQASNIAISEIAYRCGFGDLFYFSRVFKQETGVSPSDFGGSADAPRA